MANFPLNPILLQQWGDTPPTTNAGNFRSQRPESHSENNHNNNYEEVEGDDENDDYYYNDDGDDDGGMANVIPFAATMSNAGSVNSGNGGSGGKVKSLSGVGSLGGSSVNSQNTSRSILTMRRLSEKMETEDDEEEEEEEQVQLYDPGEEDDFRYAVAGHPSSNHHSNGYTATTTTGLGGKRRNKSGFREDGETNERRTDTGQSRVITVDQDQPYTVKLSHLNEVQRRDRSLFLALKPLHGREGVLLSNAKPIPTKFLPMEEPLPSGECSCWFYPFSNFILKYRISASHDITD